MLEGTSNPHEQLSAPSAVASDAPDELGRPANIADQADIGRVGSSWAADVHGETPLKVKAASSKQTVDPADSPDTVKVCADAGRPIDSSVAGRSNSAATNARRSMVVPPNPAAARGVCSPVAWANSASATTLHPRTRAVDAAMRAGEPAIAAIGATPMPGTPNAEIEGPATVSCTRWRTKLAPPQSLGGQKVTRAFDGLVAINEGIVLETMLVSAVKAAAAADHGPSAVADAPDGSQTSEADTPLVLLNALI